MKSIAYHVLHTLLTVLEYAVIVLIAPLIFVGLALFMCRVYILEWRDKDDDTDDCV